MPRPRPQAGRSAVTHGSGSGPTGCRRVQTCSRLRAAHCTSDTKDEADESSLMVVRWLLDGRQPRRPSLHLFRFKVGRPALALHCNYALSASGDSALPASRNMGAPESLYNRLPIELTVHTTPLQETTASKAAPRALPTSASKGVPPATGRGAFPWLCRGCAGHRGTGIACLPATPRRAILEHSVRACTCVRIRA